MNNGTAETGVMPMTFVNTILIVFTIQLNTTNPTLNLFTTSKHKNN